MLNINEQEWDNFVKALDDVITSISNQISKREAFEENSTKLQGLLDQYFQNVDLEGLKQLRGALNALNALNALSSEDMQAAISSAELEANYIFDLLTPDGKVKVTALSLLESRTSKFTESPLAILLNILDDEDDEGRNNEGFGLIKNSETLIGNISAAYSRFRDNREFNGLFEECQTFLKAEYNLSSLTPELNTLSNNINEMRAKLDNFQKNNPSLIDGNKIEEFRRFLDSLIENFVQYTSKLCATDKEGQSLSRETLTEIKDEAVALRGTLQVELPSRVNEINGLISSESSPGLLERHKELLKKLSTGSFVGNLCLGFIAVGCIQIILWAIGQNDTSLGNAWNTTLYSLALVGAMIYLLWIVKREYNKDDKPVKGNVELWAAIASMMPMIVGLPSMGLIKSSMYCLTMVATSIVTLYAQHLSSTGMNRKEMAILMVGNILVVLAYFVDLQKYLEGKVYGSNYQVCIAMIIFVLLLLIGSYMAKNNTGAGTESKQELFSTISYLVFTVTLLVSIFVSWVMGYEYRQFYGSISSSDQDLVTTG
ncbi:hypothetical protein EROM_091540 [Encephalitozoon romaleae SJ-2008]|uniref:Uncharacterized protein n=1 Tax=Encephalitozoon romaleae (strain SJ-2008) TaxID=1178016 RepID=I7AG87_ENCRO|nr:hypothetical protein EROM_091540 [Encephalitozoon romaleae SJ-2008]AFN83770.1 hypothetical protein EROM_091540 [Encephalitozoon romaleae SJ-2008]